MQSADYGGDDVRKGEGILGRRTCSLARRCARERGQKPGEQGQGRAVITPWRIDLPACSRGQQDPAMETSCVTAIRSHCPLWLLRAA